MTLGERIDQYIFDEGIAVEEVPLRHYNGFYDYESDWIQPIITISSEIDSETLKTATKAHELGHHFTLSTDLFFAPYLIKSRDEYRANRWAAEYYMPIEKLIELFEKGCRTPLDLSDQLEIPIEHLYSGIDIYCRKYGQYKDLGQYRIFWNPFNIKKDLRRKAK